jgi:hypothetical protein
LSFFGSSPGCGAKTKALAKMQGLFLFQAPNALGAIEVLFLNLISAVRGLELLACEANFHGLSGAVIVRALASISVQGFSKALN